MNSTVITVIDIIYLSLLARAFVFKKYTEL